MAQTVATAEERVSMIKRCQVFRPHAAAMPSEERLPRLRKLFEDLYDGTHPLRIALDKLQTLDTVRIIEGEKS